MKCGLHEIKVIYCIFWMPVLAVMSPPSRILPQRQWAASTPTLLLHEAFDSLLKPTSLQQLPLHVPLAPLERFLGCNFIRRHIVRVISQEKHVCGRMLLIFTVAYFQCLFAMAIMGIKYNLYDDGRCANLSLWIFKLIELQKHIVYVDSFGYNSQHFD